mmetsp:Transcript_18365/g.38409  ORF Transcript_18365/g.38409 Transcript_18365/m.38409 type:complete len:283 (+) Transcript_18365:54-902(+)
MNVYDRCRNPGHHLLRVFLPPRHLIPPIGNRYGRLHLRKLQRIIQFLQSSNRRILHFVQLINGLSPHTPLAASVGTTCGGSLGHFSGVYGLLLRAVIEGFEDLVIGFGGVTGWWCGGGGVSRFPIVGFGMRMSCLDVRFVVVIDKSDLRIGLGLRFEKVFRLYCPSGASSGVGRYGARFFVYIIDFIIALFLNQLSNKPQPPQTPRSSIPLPPSLRQLMRPGQYSHRNDARTKPRLIRHAVIEERSRHGQLPIDALPFRKPECRLHILGIHDFIREEGHSSY